jgi:hypothetical protein
LFIEKTETLIYQVKASETISTILAVIWIVYISAIIGSIKVIAFVDIAAIEAFIA